MALEVRTPIDAHPVWMADPFERLYAIWGPVMEMSGREGVPHLVGTIEVTGNSVTGIELSVVLHSQERHLSFREGNMIYFIVPLNPQEGVEGAYLRILDVLRDGL